jgi:hypothetical protein
MCIYSHGIGDKLFTMLKEIAAKENNLPTIITVERASHPKRGSYNGRWMTV